MSSQDKIKKVKEVVRILEKVGYAVKKRERREGKRRKNRLLKDERPSDNPKSPHRPNSLLALV